MRPDCGVADGVRPVFSTGCPRRVEMAGRAGGHAVAPHLHVPEQRLPEGDGGAPVAHEFGQIGRLRYRDGFERGRAWGIGRLGSSRETNGHAEDQRHGNAGGTMCVHWLLSLRERRVQEPCQMTSRGKMRRVNAESRSGGRVSLGLSRTLREFPQVPTGIARPLPPERQASVGELAGASPDYSPTTGISPARS
jgi:hypothetical protein